MAKKTTDSDIVAHLTRLHAVQPAPSIARSDTGGMVLNKPPTGPTVTIQEMLAAEAQAESADSGTQVFSLAHANTAVRKKIPLDLIDDSRYQPRKEYNPEEIDALSHTIAAGGQADLIKVRPVGERYELISGHRRVRATRSLGWIDIDALVEFKSDRQAEIEVMLTCVGNVALSDYEFAKMCQRAVSKGFVKKQTDAANFFGCTQSKVSGCLTMLSLPFSLECMLEKKPSLFNYTTAKILADLLKAHPEHEDIIIAGVDRLTHGMKQSALKGWIHQAITQLGKNTKQATNRKTITKRGIPVFATKVDPRAVTVMLKLPKMSMAGFEDRLTKFLECEAETYNEVEDEERK